MYSYNPYYYDYLAHHGVKGQKWGVRRYQPYTSGQKGIFKNLKRTYKSSVRSLRKDRKRFEKEGDKLAVDAATKAIKDTKKAYKTEKRNLKDEFTAENRAKYVQDVSERGSEKQIAQVRKEMTPEQLDYAVRRLNAYKDWEKTSMRDVEKEFKAEQAMEKMNRIMKGADTVRSVATATTSVLTAAKSFKELFPAKKTQSEHEKQMERYAEEAAKLTNEKLQSDINKQKADTRQITARAKQQEIKNYQSVLDYGKNGKEATNTQTSTSQTSSPAIATKGITVGKKEASTPISTVTSFDFSKYNGGKKGYVDSSGTIVAKDKNRSNSFLSGFVSYDTQQTSIKNMESSFNSKGSTSDYYNNRVKKEKNAERYQTEKSKRESIVNASKAPGDSDAARYSRFVNAAEIVNNNSKYKLSDVNAAQREVVNYLEWERKNKKR